VSHPSCWLPIQPRVELRWRRIDATPESAGLAALSSTDNSTPWPADSPKIWERAQLASPSESGRRSPGGALIERAELVQAGLANSKEWSIVRAIADALVLDLQSPEVAGAVRDANQPGRSSSAVQAVFVRQAMALGFVDESRTLFDGYESALRPDYFKPMGSTGILLEVERGKTTMNTMDILDFWKCHICEHADYLFLMVPSELRQNQTMAPRREFASVLRRLSTFFRPGNETNVRGLVLIGY
jgi:hypothetical protein